MNLNRPRPPYDIVQAPTRLPKVGVTKRSVAISTRTWEQLAYACQTTGVSIAQLIDAMAIEYKLPHPPRRAFTDTEKDKTWNLERL